MFRVKINLAQTILYKNGAASIFMGNLDRDNFIRLVKEINKEIESVV